MYNPNDDSPQHLVSKREQPEDDSDDSDNHDNDGEWEDEPKAPARSSKKKTPISSSRKVRGLLLCPYLALPLA